MRHHIVAVLTAVFLGWVLATAAAVAADSDFATFLAEKQEAIQKLRDSETPQKDVIAKILMEVQTRALAEPKGDERNGAYFWLAQQFITVDDKSAAATLYETLANDESTPPESRHRLQSQMAQLFADTGQFDKSTAALAWLLNDPATTHDEKSNLLTSALDGYQVQQAWSAIWTVGQEAEKLGLGGDRGFYMALSRADMEVGDFKGGAQAYEKLLNSPGAPMPPRMTLDYDKNLALCRNEGKTETVEYLQDLARVLGNYKAAPQLRQEIEGRLLDEELALAQGWLGIAQAYAARGEDSPVPLDQARQKAVEMASSAFEGLDALSKEDQDNMVDFNGSLMKGCFTAAASLASVGRTEEGLALLERLRKRLPAGDTALGDKIDIEGRRLYVLAEAAKLPLAKATPAPPPPMPAPAAAPLPARTAKPASPASVPKPGNGATDTPSVGTAPQTGEAQNGGMGAGTVALVLVLVGAAVLLLVLAMRKPKTP